MTPFYSLRRLAAVALLGLAVNRQVLATPEVRTLLEAARDELRAPVYLTAFHADEIVVAHIADSPAHPRIGQLHVGFADSAHVTAFGKLMLAAKSREELDRHLEERSLRAITGRIDLVHANDSRDDFDSGADRHASFGAGRIDPDLLAAVVRDAAAPVVCETPGPAESHVADFEWLRARL